MTTVTTWTGAEATALRKALRMSVTGFAEHLGVARRTVAKWSSRGSTIRLRPETQAVLDTALARAPAEVRERFDQFRAAGTSRAPVRHSDVLLVPSPESVPDTGEGERGGLGQDGQVQRRKLLSGATAGGVAALPALASVVDALLSGGADPAAPRSVPQLAMRVAKAKDDYQAGRYDNVLRSLVTLLPAFAVTRSQAGSEEQARLDLLGADLYHVVGSVLLKVEDHAMALVAAERSTRCAMDGADPVAAGTSARIMTHALMSNGHTSRAVRLAQAAAGALDQATRLRSTDSLAAYGALLLRGAIAAGQADDRDAAGAMLDEAARAATALGHDGNDRWTGFGPNNVLVHRVHVALTLGDAGTAIAFARQVQLPKLDIAERKACLFVDVARAYAQWGRHEQGLSALRTAYRIAPEEVRSRPAVHHILGDLAALSRGHTRTAVGDFAATAGIRL